MCGILRKIIVVGIQKNFRVVCELLQQTSGTERRGQAYYLSGSVTPYKNCQLMGRAGELKGTSKSYNSFCTRLGRNTSHRCNIFHTGRATRIDINFCKTAENHTLSWRVIKSLIFKLLYLGLRNQMSVQSHKMAKHWVRAPVSNYWVALDYFYKINVTDYIQENRMSSLLTWKNKTVGTEIIFSCFETSETASAST